MDWQRSPQPGPAPRSARPRSTAHRFWPPRTDKLWRSPLRGPWLTSVLGLALLVSLPLVVVTGLLDYIAYGPQFHQARPADVGWLRLPVFGWPTRPAWLFQLTQGLHVVLGLVLVPVVVAKLWSVTPRLFVWPPVRSLPHLLERLSLVLLVGGVLFEIVTGILNISYDYVFGFSFYSAHYYGAWVFIAGFVVHVALKLPLMLRSLRSRSLREELRTPLARTVPEPADADDLVASRPATATMSRRGFLGVVAGSSALVAVTTVGQVVGGPARMLAFLLPRGRSYGDGPNAFQVNKTAAAAGVRAADVGASWRLTVRYGDHVVRLDRPRLAAMAQHTARLPIACVEGWSTTQSWGGVRLRDLAVLVEAVSPRSAVVSSLARHGSFNRATLEGGQVLDPDAMLALRVNGADLSLDHGYPARVVVPAIPGVHATKWVHSIEFHDD